MRVNETEISAATAWALEARERTLLDVYLRNADVWFQDNLYWSDWEERSILQVDKQLRSSINGSYGVTNAVVHLHSPMDVQIYHELKQPSAESKSHLRLAISVYHCVYW